MVLAKFWLVFLFFLCIYFLWKRRKYYILMLKIPGPWGYPIIGMAHKLRKRDDVLREFGLHIDKYGTLMFSWLGPLPFLVVSEPQIVQDILTSPHCVNKGHNYAAIDDGMGPGLFSLKDPDWSLHRKYLNPAFGHKVLLSFLPVFNEEVSVLLQTLDAQVDNDGGAKDLMPILQKFTLRIATQTTMGSGVKHEDNFVNSQLLQQYHCLLETMANMCFSPWLISRTIRRLLGKDAKYAAAKNGIRTFIRKLIKVKLSVDEAENVAGANSVALKDKNIFLNVATVLLKKGAFSMQNVVYESNIIVFGAFETTSNTVAYILMLLSMFPTYQQQAFEELRSLFPKAGDFEVTYADTLQMVYLDLVINEAMRIMSPVPLVCRQATQDVQLSNGITIPKGVQIAIDIFHMHRSKEIWGKDAMTFNPENFNLNGKHAYAYIPFTKGIRNCIGWRYALLSMKVTLAKLLRNYCFSTDFRFEDLQYVEDITIKLKKSPLLELRRRS